MKLAVTLLLAALLFTGCTSTTDPVTPVATGWYESNPGTERDLVDVFFLDANHGWALGSFDSLLRTTNAGMTWTRHFYGNMSLESLHFTDTLNGWAVGRDGLLMHSTDGGASWSSVVYYPAYRYSHLKSVFFVDRDFGWFSAGTDGTIFRTTDAGTTWQSSSTGPGNNDQLNSLVFSDRNNGWAVGSRQVGLEQVGLILRTADGGVTWQAIPFDSLGGFSHVFFHDSMTGWVCGAQGSLLSTVDGGATWQARNSGTSAPITRVFFGNKRNGWLIASLPNVTTAGGEYRVIKRTSDGGDHWTDQALKITLDHFATPRDIHVINTSNCWVVGTRGTIWHSMTGGEVPKPD